MLNPRCNRRRLYNLLTELKERVKEIKFLIPIDGKYYEMKENEVYAKLAFLSDPRFYSLGCEV